MTEKQFNVFNIDGTIFMEDHKKGSYHIGEIGNVNVNCLNDIADRLNKLNDENEQLKKEVEFWKQLANPYSVNVFEHCKKYKTCIDMNKLYKENKELKSLCKVLITHIDEKSIAFVIDEDIRRLLE